MPRNDSWEWCFPVRPILSKSCAAFIERKGTESDALLSAIISFPWCDEAGTRRSDPRNNFNDSYIYAGIAQVTGS